MTEHDLDHALLYEPGHCISNSLQQTARAVSRLYAEEMRPAGLARSQFAVLVLLDRRGPLRMSELAGRLYMERTTLTRNLRPLERAGLIERLASVDDPRVKRVGITRSGRVRLRDAEHHWRRAQARMLERYGAERWREMEAALRTLRGLARHGPEQDNDQGVPE